MVRRTRGRDQNLPTAQSTISRRLPPSLILADITDIDFGLR
jgi:hypothetical protein